MDYNDEYFVEREKIINHLTKDMDDRKYTKLCFIDLIDEGSLFTVDEYGMLIYVKKDIEPTDYTEKPEYLSKLSSLYEQIGESIDKVKLRYEPFRLEVNNIDSAHIGVRIDIIDGRLDAERRRKQADEYNRNNLNRQRRNYHTY